MKNMIQLYCELVLTDSIVKWCSKGNYLAICGLNRNPKKPKSYCLYLIDSVKFNTVQCFENLVSKIVEMKFYDEDKYLFCLMENSFIMGIPKVSLVFPCWHAAKHMPHVLEDLQAQTFKDFEAILVNDGDDSQIPAMEEIAAKDNRIRIINRPDNGGASSARNSGMDIAKSPWIIFPDPDRQILF